MYMMELNMHSYRTILEQKTVRTVLIPIGMLEAHGEHCALGTDTLIPREFVRRLEAHVGDCVMMAPEIPYGHSWALAPWPGTIDVTAEAFSQYVYSVAEQFVKQGFEYVVFFNGHGGNMPSLSTVSEKVADLGAVVCTINWWLDYKDLIVPYAKDTGHAGEDETSCVLAIDERLVDMTQAHDFVNPVPRNIKTKGFGAKQFPHANNGRATAATREKGEQIYQALIPAILKDLETMWTFTATV